MLHHIDSYSRPFQYDLKRAPLTNYAYLKHDMLTGLHTYLLLHGFLMRRGWKGIDRVVVHYLSQDGSF